jgi:hypothetical protein
VEHVPGDMQAQRLPATRKALLLTLPLRCSRGDTPEWRAVTVDKLAAPAGIRRLANVVIQCISRCFLKAASAISDAQTLSF